MDLMTEIANIMKFEFEFEVVAEGKENTISNNFKKIRIYI